MNRGHQGTPIHSAQATDPAQHNPDLWNIFPNACLFLPEAEEVMQPPSAAHPRTRKNNNFGKFSRAAARENPATPTNAARASALSSKGTSKSSVDNIPVVRSEIFAGLGLARDDFGSPIVDAQNKNIATTAACGSPVTPSTMQLHSGIQLPSEDRTLLEVNPYVVAEAKKLHQITDADGVVTRPRIKLDINKASKDKLVLSQVPYSYTKNHISLMLGNYGKIEQIDWKHQTREVHVMFSDPKVARSACERLDKKVIPGCATLRARLRSSSPAAQLFVGDLVPTVSESMLEDAFEKIVKSKVQVTLKRDPNTRSPIGYGFAFFESEAAANKALLHANRMKVGDARIRVGRAERNCYLYVTDLAPEVTYEDLTDKFSKFGELVEEDTTIVRRTTGTIDFDNERQAIMAKAILDEAGMDKNITVSYDNCKAHIAVMFASDVTKQPNSLFDLLSTTFSKYGECNVEIPRTRGGKWRNFAVIKFKGDASSAMQAAVEAMQNVEHVSQVPVYCDWAREIFTEPLTHSDNVHNEVDKPLRSYKDAAAKALMEVAKQNEAHGSDNGHGGESTLGKSANKLRTPLKASARTFYPTSAPSTPVPHLKRDSIEAVASDFVGTVTPQPHKKMPFATDVAGPSEKKGNSASPTPEKYVRIMVPRDALQGMFARGTVPGNWIVSPPRPTPVPDASPAARNH